MRERRTSGIGSRSSTCGRHPLLPPELSGLLEAGNVTAREAAWQTFVETHSRLLLHTARTLGRDYDATMDAYAHLLDQLRHNDFHRLRSYTANSGSKFTTWLVVVARRLCLDRLRQRYGRRQDASSESREGQAARRRLVDLLAEDLDPSDVADPASRTPETDLRAAELSLSLTNALSRLEPRDRLLLTLRFEDGLPAREIGQVMGFPTPFHVYRRIHALLEGLQAVLRRRGVEDSEP